MLRSRIVPCLLLDQGRLVKTTNFAEPKYVGDPLNTVRIFNEKKVDELFLADVSASRLRASPDIELLKKLASESRMPLSYCGGIRRVEEFEELISIGIEKVGICSSFLRDESLVARASTAVGSQSVVVVLNSIRSHQDPLEHLAFDSEAGIVTGQKITDLVKKAEDLGAGELVIYSVDRDGRGNGFDFEMASSIRTASSLPLTIVGGAGNSEDLCRLSADLGPIGIGAGSLFVFTGKFRSVLIQYPDEIERELIYGDRKQVGLHAN